jgi:hypothetical protein
MSSVPTCTVQVDTDGTFCEAPSAADMPFPICPRHALRLFNRLQQMAQDRAHAAPVAALLDNMAAWPASLPQTFHAKHDDVIYYVRFGDIVKIGTTRNLRNRLNTYPPTAVLLAVEPGGLRLEAERHAQFAHLLAYRNEWFFAADELLEFAAFLSQSAA